MCAKLAISGGTKTVPDGLQKAWPPITQDGIVTTNDEEMYERARQMAMFGEKVDIIGKELKC